MSPVGKNGIKAMLFEHLGYLVYGTAIDNVELWVFIIRVMTVAANCGFGSRGNPGYTEFYGMISY